MQTFEVTIGEWEDNNSIIELNAETGQEAIEMILKKSNEHNYDLTADVLKVRPMKVEIKICHFDFPPQKDEIV